MKQEEEEKRTKVVFQPVEREKKIIEKTKRYEITAYYPITDSIEWNNAIVSLVQKHISQFKEEIGEDELGENQVDALNILYQTYTSKDTISYLFTITMDTHGAHPNTIYDSTVYHVTDKKIVTIDDIVHANPLFLETVSTKIRKRLEKNPGIVNYSMMIAGTEPKKENFKNFAITEEGYLFFFAPYQVAPYSSGRFQVCIPFSEISSLSR